MDQKPSCPCGREWPQGGQAAGEGTQDQLAVAEADLVVESGEIPHAAAVEAIIAAIKAHNRAKAPAEPQKEDQ